MTGGLTYERIWRVVLTGVHPQPVVFHATLEIEKEKQVQYMYFKYNTSSDSSLYPAYHTSEKLTVALCYNCHTLA